MRSAVKSGIDGCPHSEILNRLLPARGFREGVSCPAGRFFLYSEPVVRARLGFCVLGSSRSAGDWETVVSSLYSRRRSNAPQGGASIRRRQFREAAFRASPEFALEVLEPRTLLSTYTVTGTGDAAQIITQTGPTTFNASTLRAAIVAANGSAGADTINFQAGVNGIIALASPLEVSDTSGATTISGPGSSLLTVSGNQPVLLIDIGVSVVISTLSFAGATVNPAAPQGGGIRNSGSLTLTNVSFGNNQSAGNGGAIDNESVAVITGCTFAGNIATGLGGGIYNAGSLSVSATTFVANSAASGGGIYNDAAVNTAASVLLNGSTLSGNTASAIISSGALSLVNCTVANNAGGGVGIVARSATLTNTTITANTGNLTPVLQAGLFITAGATVTMNNSIVAGNTAGSPTPIAADISGTVVPTSKRNLIGTGGSGGLTNGGSSGNQTNNATPGLGVLGSYGGPVQTVPLLIGSPAIDSGNNPLAVDASGTALTVDARGFPRRSNATVDKGAYEVQSIITVNTIQDETTANATTSLREAVLLANADLGPELVTVNFDSTVFGTASAHTIALAQGLIEFTARPNATTTIQGPGASVLLISGQNTSQLLLIDFGASAIINAATLTAGFSSQGPGGAIVNLGTLAINTSALSSNSVVGFNGGAIYNPGTLSLSTCTLSSNTASASSAQGSGGAIYSTGALSVTSSTFTQNSASGTGTGGAGGAIKATGSLSIVGGSFSQNTASNTGGAIDSSGRSSSLTNVSLDHNSVSAGNTAGIGGAINIANGSLAVVGCTLTSNSAYNAGAIANAATLSVITSTLSSNAANASAGSGGAIANYNKLTMSQTTVAGNTAGGYGAGLENLATADLAICTFSGNVAQTMGGAIYTAGPFTLSGSTLSSNEAVQFGGAGLASTGNSLIVDSTFASNLSDGYDGGGVMVFAGSTRLTNDTLSLNKAPNGSGVVVYAPATLTANNSIIAGNTLLDGQTPNDVLGNISGSFDLLANAGSSGLVNGVNGNIVGLSPNLAPLDFYGGTVQTMPLVVGSPAIDAGSTALALDVLNFPLASDERGENRYYGNVDIGAVEFQPIVLTITTNTDGLILKRETDNQHIDWSISPKTGRIPLFVGEPVIVSGSGLNDAVTLDYTNGNPLPPIIQLNGTFTVSGLQGVNPLAGINIDINRSTLYFKYSSAANDPIALIKSYLMNAYNGGLWNGLPNAATGVLGSSAAKLNSVHSTTIGYADSADGLPANLVANTVKIEYTLYGDTDLTGSVNFTSFMRLTQHFNQAGGAGWDVGDFNFDGVVDVNDFNLLALNYGTVLGSQALPPDASVALATFAPTVITSAVKCTDDPGDRKKNRPRIDQPAKPKVKPPGAIRMVQGDARG